MLATKLEYLAASEDLLSFIVSLLSVSGAINDASSPVLPSSSGTLCS